MNDDHLTSRAAMWNDIEGRGRPRLDSDINCDVCIVGAGIAGLSTAYHVAAAGLRVVVIDKGAIGGGETIHTTAHLSNAIDDRYYVIRRLHGVEGSRICAASHTAAIDQIQSIALEEGIQCQFHRVDGYLFLPPGEPVSVLELELECAREARVPDVEMLERAPLESFDTGPCLRFGRQGEIHPIKYLTGLARAIERLGGRIFCNTEMHALPSERPLRVETMTGHVIRAESVVVATNTPIINRVAIHTKQAPHRTYVVAFRVPARRTPRALYWDTKQDEHQSESGPYHYVRLSDSIENQHEELLIVGGEDHKTGQEACPEECWSRLEHWTRARFGEVGSIAYRWSGQVFEPVDKVAFIGPNPGGPDHVYIATGDSGMGMTHGTIAGMLLTDLIEGRPNSWAKLYDPSRITLRSGWEFARENLNTAVQYMDWFRPGEIASVDEIPPGSGALLRKGLSLIAVYKDEAGGLHEFSAVCTHLGGIVNWNSAEGTWDCPCHGSRFDAEGMVLNGPAMAPLQPACRGAFVTR